MPWALPPVAGLMIRIETFPARGNFSPVLKVDFLVRGTRLIVTQPVPAALPWTLTFLPGAAGVTLPPMRTVCPTPGVGLETFKVTLNLGAAVALSATSAMENEPAMIISSAVRSRMRAVVEFIYTPGRFGSARAPAVTAVTLLAR